MEKYLILFALILIQGCSGGGGDAPPPDDALPPTDPGTVFPLFNAGQFVAGYTDTITLTGSNTEGDTFTGSFSVQTQPESTFLSMPAIPFLTELQLSNTKTGDFVATLGTSYYTTLATDRHYLGYSNLSVTISSAVREAIPQSAKIGDFGVIGTYTDNAGNVDAQSWSLDDAGGGFANRVELSTVTDPSGKLNSSSVTTSKIDANGNLLSYKYVIFIADTNVTTTLIGN